VLTLKVKNNSPDLAFCPLDPAFNRKTFTGDTPGTRLVIGTDMFFGGPINWPFKSARQFEQAQEKDAEPLRPGESRDYAVCSANDGKILTALKKSKEAALWRVQVRRGLYQFREKDVPVTAIVGVEFQASQVTGL
jgi:hypothetical protein